ncbi:hypothetical protein AURDEDRAFT_112003 [Auricularia subglabra TFB-10046 SS5]|nr:hypothetical protein AURDEDRAFT_112003 [Auricularia subglabra TFB-10046 SS5]
MTSTPPRQTHASVSFAAAGQSRKIYTAAEKQHMLNNLELEVADRAHKFEKQMADVVAAFVVRSENEVTKVPRAVRAMLLSDFARHGGDIKRAMHALAKDRLDAIPDASREHVAMSVKKRKWDRDDDGARPNKAVRTHTSPAKAASKPSGIPGRATPKTPGRVLGRGPPAFGSPMLSPSKLTGPGKRPPSTALFNPLLPKTPAFPARSAVLRRQPSFAIQPASSGSGAKEAMALVSVPTKDGQVIELDPLSASPSAIDRLEGISDSAKKHAKDEMSRLVHGALSKWRIA